MAASLKRAGSTTAGLILISAALGGCNSMTYGTGVSPGKQTVSDITGLVNIGGSKHGPIEYAPRPPVVAPPPTAALPLPGSAGVVASAGDWPKDPDEAARASKAAAAKVPRTGDPAVDALYDPGDTGVRHDDPNSKDGYKSPQELAVSSKAQDEKVRKLMAEAKSGASVDANGNPVRKTLSDPPVVYRAPDPNAPTEFKSAKKFHWPWQKLKPDEATPAALTDDSASAEKTTQ